MMYRRYKQRSNAELLMPVVLLLTLLPVALGKAFLPGILMVPALVFIGVVLVFLFLNRATYEVAEMCNPFPVESGKPVTAPVRERLQQVDWFAFEKLITEVYRSHGYIVEKIGGAQPDGGVDLRFEREGQGSIVQCKHWRRWKVGVSHVRELLGAMSDVKVSTATLVTLSGYTDEARNLAARHNITLLEETDLIEMIGNENIAPAVDLILNDTQKYCPRCEQTMVLRTATRGRNIGGQFWGCSDYPRCTYTTSQ
jgi:hypothetical protein